MLKAVLSLAVLCGMEGRGRPLQRAVQGRLIPNPQGNPWQDSFCQASGEIRNRKISLVRLKLVYVTITLPTCSVVLMVSVIFKEQFLYAVQVLFASSQSASGSSC